MKLFKLSLITIISFLLLVNCGSDKKSKFPVDKRYWDLDDYTFVVQELRYGYNNDEKLPSFDDPNTRIIVEKLTDQQNFKVILDDKELGLKYKNKIARSFFNRWVDMTKIYTAIDRKDKYVYDKEYIEVFKFGLAFQLRYFQLGNEEVKQDADNPESLTAKSQIKSNIKTLIDNYIIYLDIINEENAFSEEGKKKIAEGIDKYFTKLVEIFPDANYSTMKNKANLMYEKSENQDIKSSLKKLINLIDSNSTKE